MSSKLLVSDYDGTLKYTKYNLKINIEAVEKFMAEGNIFAISTGRPFNSIKTEIEKYNIPFNYLGCTDGSLLYDSNYNLIKKHEFRDEEVEVIDAKLVGVNAPFIKDFYNQRDVLQYYSDIFKLNNKDYIRKNFMSLFEENNDFLDTECFKFDNYAEWLLLRPKGINKTMTAYDIMEFRGDVSKRDVVTIGDGDNDITMINEFNGYTLWTAKESVRTLCKERIVCSVSDLIGNIKE